MKPDQCCEGTLNLILSNICVHLTSSQIFTPHDRKQDVCLYIVFSINLALLCSADWMLLGFSICASHKGCFLHANWLFWGDNAVIESHSFAALMHSICTILFTHTLTRIHGKSLSLMYFTCVLFHHWLKWAGYFLNKCAPKKSFFHIHVNRATVPEGNVCCFCLTSARLPSTPGWWQHKLLVILKHMALALNRV